MQHIQGRAVQASGNWFINDIELLLLDIFLFQRSARYRCLWSMALVDSEDWAQHTTCSTNNLRSGWIQAKRLGCGVWTPGYVGTLTMEDDAR